MLSDENILKDFIIRFHTIQFIEDETEGFSKTCDLLKLQFSNMILKNQSDIIEYIIQYNYFEINWLEYLNWISLDTYIELIKNDYIESFIFIVSKIKIHYDMITDIIIKTRDILTIDYVKVMYDNNLLDTDHIKLLKKHHKNNPDKALKKYIKKISRLD